MILKPLKGITRGVVLEPDVELNPDSQRQREIKGQPMSIIEIVETEDLIYTTVAHTPREADITVISHVKQRRTGTGISHSYLNDTCTK